MAELVYLNGALVPRSEAKVSVFDFGFLYGYGLFETMRAYRGKIFLLDRHIKRLLTSAKEIGIDSALSQQGLEKACADTVEANGLRKARVRLTVTKGAPGAFPGVSTKSTPTVLVTARDYKPLSDSVYEKGFKACISSWRRDSRSPLSRLKTTNYLLSLLAKGEAEAVGFDEALLLNERGSIAEGSTSNVFFVDSGLVTPPVASGILPGIARQVVLELAEKLGIEVVEKEVRLADLSRFNEAFLTNSIMEIMPLITIRDAKGAFIKIGSGKPGKVTRRLMAAYRKMVERATA